MDTNHNAPVEPATITPGPFSEQELREAWNSQADQYSQWDELDSWEQLAIAQTRAIAADRAGRAAPPAEGELADLAGHVAAWAARLEEGTPEERLLGRIAEVLRQRQAPPHQGEVDALIKILSRMARQLDFMPDGPPNGPVIHRVIELLRQLTPPAEGAARQTAAALRRLAAQNPMGVADPVLISAAALLQQQAAELATLRQLAEEILALVSESEGVAGLHLNGDLAPWDELLPGGRFERLTSLPSEDRPHA